MQTLKPKRSRRTSHRITRFQRHTAEGLSRGYICATERYIDCLRVARAFCWKETDCLFRYAAPIRMLLVKIYYVSDCMHQINFMHFQHSWGNRSFLIYNIQLLRDSAEKNFASPSILQDAFRFLMIVETLNLRVFISR